MRVFLWLLLTAFILSGCVGAPPSHPANLCSIFREKNGWYQAAKHAQQRWGAPISVQMAIINQESSYQAKARPPRAHILGIIPWKHISSAYGYTQALDSTWQHYKNQTGHHSADRDNFTDATDFVGWYIAHSHRALGISKADAYSQYLAYYLGAAGYRKGVFRHKAWLRRAAHRVQNRANLYRRQLAGCRAQLEQHGHWWWPL